MEKAVYLTITQYDNLGDLIINKCLIDELSKHVQLYLETANVPHGFLKSIQTNPNIKYLNEEFGFSFKRMSIIKFLLMGNTPFHYLFKSPGPIRYGRPSRLLSIDGIRNLVFKTLNKKVKSDNIKSFVIGSEISFESEEAIDRFKKSSAKTHKFYLRSKTNVSYLQTLNVTNVEYIPDLCFLLKEKVKSSINNKNKVGISFRDLSSSNLYEKIKKSVAIFTNYYLAKGFEVVFFYQVTRDFEYNHLLYQDFEDEKMVSFKEQPLALDEIDFYSEFRTVISNRLHVLLLGFIHNCLALPLIDDNSTTNKIIGIYESIDCKIPIFSLLTDENLKSIDNKYNSLIPELDQISQAQCALCQEKIKSIFNNVESIA